MSLENPPPYEWEDANLRIVRIDPIEEDPTNNDQTNNSSYNYSKDESKLNVTEQSWDYFQDETDESAYLKEIMRRSALNEEEGGGEDYEVDDIVEIGGREVQDERRRNTIQLMKRRQKRRLFKTWISNHRFGFICMAMLMLVIAMVLASVLAYLKLQDRERAKSIDEDAGSIWVLGPTVAPNGSPNPFVPTDAPSKSHNQEHPTYASLKDRLVELFGPDYVTLLHDVSTPQGKAYEWILSQDELAWDHNHPLVVQRYILAEFYFATGGGRITSSWDVCSAVPVNTTLDANTFNTKCVTENDQTICALIDDFEECPEYYERWDFGTPKVIKKRWLSGTSECDWYGIFCNRFGQVTQLSLANNGLNGTLVQELKGLEHLTSINLMDNDLHGSLPSWVGLNLEHLSLSDNALEGTIPMEWRLLKNLETLDLSHNPVEGFLQLPNQWMELKTLILGGIKNNLTIELHPDFGNVITLQVLDLHGNFVESGLPDSMGNLLGLVELNLAKCGLSGSIPSWIGNFVPLVELDLNDNLFTGTLPEGLYDLTNLEILRLENQMNSLSGTLSTEIGNLVDLVDFRISKTGLSGDLPEELSNLVNAERLHFEFNEFWGEIPEDLCSVETLKDLQADCDKGDVDCSCCTKCCSVKKGKCKEP